MLQYEMAVVDLQEVMVEFVFFMGPVSLLNIFGLFLHCLIFQGKAALHGLFFVLFFAELDMTFLPEKRLEVVARNDLFLLLIDTVVVIYRWIGIGRGSWRRVIDGLAQERGGRRMGFGQRIAFRWFGSLFPLCFACHLNFYGIFGII